MRNFEELRTERRAPSDWLTCRCQLRSCTARVSQAGENISGARQPAEEAKKEKVGRLRTTQRKKKKVKPEVEHQAPVGCSSMESESFSGRQRASFFFFLNSKNSKNIFKFLKILFYFLMSFYSCKWHVYLHKFAYAESKYSWVAGGALTRSLKV